METQPPTFEDIVAARKFISPYLPKTPLILARDGKQVAEGAGAASLAAAIKIKDQLRGKTVVGIVSGGNIPPERFAKLLTVSGG